MPTDDSAADQVGPCCACSTSWARLAEDLPNAVLLAYPDSGHGSLFQFHDSFTRHAAAFLASDAAFAPY